MKSLEYQSNLCFFFSQRSKSPCGTNKNNNYNYDKNKIPPMNAGCAVPPRCRRADRISLLPHTHINIQVPLSVKQAIIQIKLKTREKKQFA